ncbi:Putative protein kinase [Septoria linicola]|uniref:Protein kinase domain-containing protein n=1 Tax=Septoria linicola TaxID=215465 RepID=A0A9Q9AQT0_9PEZI|nr:putative protein kinase [Septoria linicola]USW50361.1 Putative protein kinase [Septoria linicola]
MSGIYRAPEVLLGLPWSHPVDIWSLGVMTLELLEGKNLFDPIDRSSNHYVLPLGLAHYVGYLGPPPVALLERSELMDKYFNAEGNWISNVAIPETSLEDFVVSMPPGREKTTFLCFVRKMLTWDPEARATSNELFMDEWLMTDFDGLQGQFTKFSLPNQVPGSKPHCPHIDLEEVRHSLTVSYKRSGEQETTVHLFADGTTKTREEMHADNNRRKAEFARLEVEEKKFPDRKQTAARKAAYDSMMQQLRDLRDAHGMNVAAKVSMKERSMEDYQRLLREQAQARFEAAKETAAAAAKR